MTLGISLPSDISLSSDSKGSWDTKLAMPTERVGHGVVSCNGKIYVIGGYNNSGFLDTVEVYDPINNIWETKKPMPYGKAEFGICVIGTNIYVIGGCNSLLGKPDFVFPANILDSVFVYDTKLDNWSIKTPMPTPRISLSLGVVNGKIYAIGGAELKWNDCCFYLYKAIDTNEVYNPINDSWEILPSMIKPRHHVGVAVINDKIFVCGGNKNDDLLLSVNTVEVYSTNTNTWDTLASMPKRLTGFGIISVNDKIYVIGGLSYPNYHVNDVFVYNPRKDQWSNLSSLPTIRYGLGACELYGKIYAIGGAVNGIRSYYSENNYYLTENEELTLPLSNITYSWHINFTFPSENAVLSDSLTIFGTASVTNTTLQSVQIKIDNNSWIKVNGTESWSYDFDTTNFIDGDHVISIRGYDGISYSHIEKINITVQNIQEFDDATPGFELIIVLVAFVFYLFWKRKR